MSPEASKAPRPPKASTRSSIRQSLNFTSVGKALADVMNKDSREREPAGEKGLKKSKETSSRRLSAIALMNSSAIPHASATGHKSKSPTPGHAKEDGSPTSKTITRNTRRQSGLLKPPTPASSDEQCTKSPLTTGASPTVRRSATLRPRTAPAPNSSALPKLRPKSVLVEQTKKPATPTRVGTRRRLSSSEEDDKNEKGSPKGKGASQSPADKTGRPISPLPHRALAVKVNLPPTPSTPGRSVKQSPPKSKPKTPPAKTASPRPTKSVKTAASSSASRPTIVRPPSSSSSCSSTRTESPPKSQNSFKNAFGFGTLKGGHTSSPLRTTVRVAPESPLAHHSRRTSSGSLGGKTTPTQPTSTHYIEETSEDSLEVDDVELLLAPIASLAAPTPAIPRIHNPRQRHQALKTPSRPSQLLPSRANLSYLSPLPPNSESSPALRPGNRGPGNDRGSILSWEQLANEGSQLLGEDEVDSMLADVPAPFTPGGPSPNMNAIGLEVPESPSLLPLPSPGGYTSISQVLLPDVTPSPAVHHITPMFDTSTELPPPVDSGIVTLLRLQVASAENTAKERLTRLQELEEQLHITKRARIMEAEELSKQVSYLEEQLHGSVEARERMDEERAAFTASLQDQLRHTEARCEQAVEAALARAQEEAGASLAAQIKLEQRKWETSCVARGVATEWASIRDQAEVELESLRANRETLDVFMAVLDQSHIQVQQVLA
ncbi:hypothetical protein BJ138DRAFT_1142440 [Hygrophoropsis aurantiaca]|uniref:Uncharacterized protein n=1 Tax=Hygrophoropsis aurantiaca TaxID=72124 RepID=A0ACB8ANV9_9AGAM|nr:hypothetical protein BJ138DRAFT_1142440 [Hygrophoropsis aurantiaca]